MAIETKMLFSLVLDTVARSTSLEEAYEVIATAANVEGINALSYDDAVKKYAAIREKSKNNKTEE